MLSRLLESKARRTRSPLGMATSIAAHLVVVVAAIHATAQSRPRAPEVARITMLPFVPQQPKTERRGQQQQQREPSPKLPALAPLNPLIFDPRIPSIDFIPPSPTRPTDFQGRGLSTTPAPDPSPSNPGEVFRADQVERQVTLLAGAAAPRYPEALRSAGIEGKVTAQFTVNELGLVEADSVRFIESDNVLFEESVRAALRRMRFSPAEVGGKTVRQLVQMPFIFTLSAR